MGSQNKHRSGRELIEWHTPDIGTVLRISDTLEQFVTPYQQVEVLQTPQFGRLFRLDGCLMTSEADEWFYHENLTHLAAISHPEPKTALIIGGGDGGSARQLLKHPSLEKIVICELDSGVVAMARRHLQQVHQGALDDAKVALIIADGLEYVANRREPVDLLVLDLTDPQGHAEALYQAPFFAECARLLGEDGVLSLHLASPQYHPERVTELLARLHSHFARVRPYLVPIALYGGIWAMACASQRTDPQAISREEAEARLQARAITGLHYYNGDTHQAVLALPNFVRQLLPSINDPALP